MSYKILEQNGVDNENIDGGAFNNFSAGNRDGIIGGVLAECVVAAAGNSIGISPGELIIHGIRVKLISAEILMLPSAPAEPIRYQVIAQVEIKADKDIVFSLFVQEVTDLIQEELYTSDIGTYQVELARFTHDPSGRVEDLSKTLDIIYGGTGDGGDFEIGDVTSHGIDANLPAEVEVNKRVEDGKTYIDFEFYFPDIPAECAQTNGTYPNMSVGTATNATNAESAVKAKQDGDGNEISTTYAKQNGSYPQMTVGSASNSQNVAEQIGGKALGEIFESDGTTAKEATNATNAENAVKAEQDGDGNEISTTYAKQNGTYPGLTAGAAQRVARAGIINSGRQGWWEFLDVQYTGSTSADAALDEIFVVNGVLDDGEDKTLAAALLELRGVYSPQASEWTEYSLVYLGGDMPYTRFCVYTDTDGLHVSQNGNESELELVPVSSKSTGFTVSYGGGPSTPPESANAPEVLLPKLNESARVYYYKLLHFAGEIGDSYALEESNIDSGDNTLAVGDYVQDGSGMMLCLTGVNDGSGLATGILLGRYIPYYLKPPGGIPESDMAQDVQTSLSKADTSLSYTQQTLTSEQQAQARTNIGAQAEGDYYVKPSGGIPETDLSAEAQAALEKANEALTEIPVASVIQLGGVKPVGKDGDMTQNVGIDAQGRLYTYPAVTYVPVLFKSTYDLPDTVGSSVGLDDAFLTPAATNIKAGDLVYDGDGRIGKFTSDYDDSGINIAQTLYVSGEYATISDVNAKYTKPASGIPESDLSQSVQTLLDAADTAYQKPAGGIPKSDLAGDVQASLDKADSALQSAPVTSVAGKTGAVTLAKGDVGLSNVDNVKQYSASNPPPYPVTSVAGKTGAVALAKGDVGLGNVDNVQQYSASNPPPYPVTSVNGQTGAVEITAANVETLSGLDFDPGFGQTSGNIVGYRIGKLVVITVVFTPGSSGIAWRDLALAEGIPIPASSNSDPIPQYVGTCIPETPCALSNDDINDVQFNLRAYKGSSRLWIHRCTNTNGAAVGAGVQFRGTIVYICQ